MDDAALVGLALADPRQGIAAIYERHGTGLHNYCLSLLRSNADAADALQETFLVVMDKLGQLRDPAKLRPWLYAIARNQCHKRHRHRGREQPDASVGLDQEHTAVADASAESGELVALVWQATAGLSEVDRSVLELNIRHELDGQELADSLGVSSSRGSVMLHRAKERLRTAVSALIVSRVGVEACSDLAGIVTGNEFTPLLRKRVARHITGCTTCEQTERNHRPEAYLTLVPLVPVPDSVAKVVLAAIEAEASAAAAPSAAGTTPDGATPDPLTTPATTRATEGMSWRPDGFPDPPSVRRLELPFIAGAAAAVVILLVVLVAAVDPFQRETTVVAGPAPPTPETTALAAPRPLFLPTEPPQAPEAAPPPDPTRPAVIAVAPDPTATPPPAPTATPTVAATPPPAAAAPTPTPTPTATASPTPTATPSPTPTLPPPTPTPPPTPQSTVGPPTLPTAPGGGQIFVDFVPPVVSSFVLTCGDPFVATVVIDDVVDPNPIADLDATWDDESDPAIALGSIGDNTYRVQIPRPPGEGTTTVFVRGVLRDASDNTRAVDLSDTCTVID